LGGVTGVANENEQGSMAAREAASARALDPVAQISLFGKLKLTDCANCARVGNHAGFFCLLSLAESTA
jgi:hypothetical protein